ncbi:MAG: HlyD family efflux transporter periplasmic adaptor subunit [Patescibacteria group bacterium]|nr:HlyD family efflux transporter periplasmic adaptor subunit [Patescibacteria group bacterium]
MKKNILIVILIIVGISLASFYNYFFVEKQENFKFAFVEQGDIIQEVLGIGTVSPSEEIELQFKTTEKIKNIFVKTGDKVKSNQMLAKLDISSLNIKKEQASASTDLAKAKLDQLLAGKSAQEIEIYETARVNAEKSVQDTEIALNNAEQNLEDVEEIASINLNQSYEDAVNVLDDAHLKSYNVYNTIDLIQRTYFTAFNQEALIIKENKNIIKQAVSQIEFYVALAKTNKEIEKDTAIKEVKNQLNQISNSLIIVRDIIEEPMYRDSVSSSYKTSLDTHRTNILSAIVAVANSQQSISLLKITNQYNINSAQTQIDTAKSGLNTAESVLQSAINELTLAKSEPRETDIALYKAQIKEAEANLSLIEKQIQDAILSAPVSGIIISVEKEVGETAIIGSPVIKMISENKYQVEAQISETDIGKIELFQAVQINLDAFMEKDFFGKVVKIDPTETILQGVVYYKIFINFDRQAISSEDTEWLDKIKPGMTVNIVIITNFRENALFIPQRAIMEKNNKKYVRIQISENDFEEKIIETGIMGNNGRIEIISGLKQGDKIIISIIE